MFRPLVTLLLSISTLLLVAAPSKLAPGDPAPAFKVGRWLKGESVPALQKGKVYVVEFWATWCAPCKKAIPHITELAKTYEGKVTFIGIDVWEKEKGDALNEKVDAFVKDMGLQMTYRVAQDTADGAMAKAWLEASSTAGIPAAFIVKADGTIAWMGNPLVDLDQVLPAVLNGTYDVAGAAAIRRAEQEVNAKANAKASKFYAEIVFPLGAANDAGDFSRVLALIRDCETRFPSEASGVYSYKFRALLHTAPDQAKASINDDNQFMAADVIVDESGLDRKWYDFALTAIEAQMKFPDIAPMMSGRLAKALHRVGRNREAVMAQQTYLAALRDMKIYSEAEMNVFEKDLLAYMAAADHGNSRL